jgi:hypothetical protein
MTTATKGAEATNVGEEENYKFRITCSKFEQFEPGSQVFIRYGKYSNRQLLSHYEFTIKNNIFNYARIKVRLGYFLNTAQTLALGKGYSADLQTVFKLRPKEICLDLLKVFRAFSWNIDSHTPEAFFLCSDLDLEIVSLEKMKGLLIEIMSNYPTTIDQDEEILKSATSRKYFAVRYRQVVYRIGVKKVILRQIESVSHALDIVKNTKKNTRADLNGIEEHSKTFTALYNRKSIKNYLDLLRKYFNID